MSKVKLFYSYSHIDENYRNTLEVHLATLRNSGLIDEWHDRKIDAGDDWDDEIEKNMELSNIILLLFSPEFIASSSCQKEVETAMRLKKEKGTIFIPIILRTCAWTSVDGISSIQALPKDGKAISTWQDQDQGWVNVFEGIKKKVEKIRSSITPKLKENFKTELLNNPVENCTLEKLFVFPDILKTNTSLKQKLENNEIDAVKLQNLETFEDRYILLEGEEQSGKTSLCNMLCVHYSDAGFYPVIIEGKNITGKAEIKKVIEKKFNVQYESTTDYWAIDKEKRILLIDDVDEWNANLSNFTDFIALIPEYFEYSIVFIDKLSNLSDRSTEHNYFSFFQNYSIRHLGHKKRNDLIKKCIAHDEQIEFDDNNTEQLARLDKDTKHINTIIGSNIVPSNPLFIVTIFHTVETAASHDLSQTSYGHCYHAMITMNLGRAGMKAEDIDSCFNFLTELSYFIFETNSKIISDTDLNQFTLKYKEMYVVQDNIVDVLIRANILSKRDNSYCFQYIYIYYYFVAKYISQKMDTTTVKEQIAELMSNIHMKDNANIIIFVTHHSNNKVLLDDITLSAMSTFDKFPEATLSGIEKNFIKALSDNLEISKLPDSTHNINKERDANLEHSDKLAPLIERIEDAQENNHDPLFIEIRKSAKSMEIIGQILKNQYGSLKKPQLEELFEEGQNVGLRLLKSFIDVMINDREGIDKFIQRRIKEVLEEKGKTLSKEEKEKESQKFLAQFSYSIVFGWLHKIADSLGYDKLTGIADSVNNKTDTVASKLINLSIHTWYAKKLDIEKLKTLHREFDDDNNHQAVYILKDIVSRHIYMHPTDYKDKQRIDSLLGFSVQKQESIQQKLKPNLPSHKS
jgi:energy-coupling factor transporter ATP-binding protein EcfA2